MPALTLASRENLTPYIESRALRKKLQGVKVNASSYGGAERDVYVGFVNPDMELRSAEYPGIYISYAGNSIAHDREHRGPVNLMYAPAGLPSDVQVPADMNDPDNTDTVSWGESFDRHSSPYHVADHPIPYNLDFNVTVVTRNYQQMFEIIAQLDEIERIPARFGGLEVPEDGTIRTLDLLGGPDTSVLADETGKRLVQSVYSVRVHAEIILYDVESVTRVTDVVTDVNLDFQPYL